jgi:hypothetical protein
MRRVNEPPRPIATVAILLLQLHGKHVVTAPQKHCYEAQYHEEQFSRSVN